MSKPPKSPPSDDESGTEADHAPAGDHARGGAEQEETTRKESKGRPPQSKR